MPIDRTAKTALDANLVNGQTSDAPKIKANNDALYNNADALEAAQNAHALAAVLPHADQSVTTAKIKDLAVTTVKIADAAVTPAKIPNASLTFDKFVPSALKNETQNALRLDEHDAQLADIANQLGVYVEDFTSIQTSIDYAVANGIKTVRLKPGKTYTITSKITIDASKVVLIGERSVIDASAITVGEAINITSSALPWTQSITVMQGVELIGTNRTSTATGIKFEGTASNGPSHVNLRNMNIHGFDRGVDFGAESYIINFYDSDFHTCDTGVYHATSSNAGERLTFIGCSFFDNNLNFESANPNGHMFFTNCSHDYSTRMGKCTAGGRVTLIGCHIEGNEDTDYWFNVQGNGAVLQIHNCELVLANTKANFEMFYCNSDVSKGGIDISDSFVAVANFYQLQYLVGGEGRVHHDNIKTFYNDVVPSISKSGNLCRDGGFNDANALLDWTLGTKAPTIDSVTKYSGTGSLKFGAAVDGDNPSITKLFPIKSGQSFALSYRKKAELNNKGFYLQLNYTDSAGNNLTAPYNADSSTGSLDWTLVKVNFGTLPPVGSANLKVVFVADPLNLADKAWIDDFSLNVL